jgi:hypothetical protein
VAEENRLYDIAYRLTELAFPLPLPSTESLRTLKVGEDLQGALTLILRNQHIVEARKAWNTVRAATLRALATLVAKGEAGENIHGDPAAIKDFHERIVEIPKPARHVARPKMPHPKIGGDSGKIERSFRKED